jgi:hypothetical protein
MKKNNIKPIIDLAWNAHLTRQCWLEAEKLFGQNVKELTISKCSEPEFKLWWENNKNIPYNSYYYEVAQFVWNEYSTYIAP